MKIVKVKANKQDNDELDLFHFCQQLERKYRHKFDNMELYVDSPILKDDEVEIRINWSAIGSQKLSEAKKFAVNLQALVLIAEKVEKEIKAKFPEVKVSK